MELEEKFEAWLIEHKVVERYGYHASLVAVPMSREEIKWAQALEDYSDANSWAESLIADCEDFEIQAMAAATEEKTVAQARGVCHDYIRWARALRRLAASSENRTMALQTLLRRKG